MVALGRDLKRVLQGPFTTRGLDLTFWEDLIYPPRVRPKGDDLVEVNTKKKGREHSDTSTYMGRTQMSTLSAGVRLTQILTLRPYGRPTLGLFWVVNEALEYLAKDLGITDNTVLQGSRLIVYGEVLKSGKDIVRDTWKP
ncbi:hypothetical protein Fmac_014984 [Flemingia macrophylla]|uniref:Uncharacterized protein n=1 Tax=Flemingia macrophylla TaxID=520843 RepID=A0ABD1MDA2_9FABA